MANDEREATAEIAKTIMGWRVVHYIKGVETEGFHQNRTHFYIAPDDIKRSDLTSDWSTWSPFTDRNHAAEMEARLKELGLAERYGEALRDIISPDTEDTDGVPCISYYGCFELATASPMQRCKAALLAVTALKSATKEKGE